MRPLKADDTLTQFTHRLRGLFNKRSTAWSRSASEEFLKSLNLIVGLDQLLENFSAKLKEILDAESLSVVLFEPITNRYVGKEAKGSHTGWLPELNFFRNDSLIKWLSVNQCPLDVRKQTEVMQFLSTREKDLLHKTKTVLVVPLIVINRLTGALFVGMKLTGESYSPEEIGLLSMLTSQSALALEHALIFQFQEDKLKRLFHAEKLATVGELAAGAAHEIRNPLTSIRSTVQYLQKDLPEEKKSLVDGIIEEADRIDQIIKGLLSFSKSSELHMSTVNVEDILSHTLFLLDSEIRKHNIEVKRKTESADTTITGDASQLKQVFLNIFLNSIQAMPNGGVISLAITESAKQDTISGRGDSLWITIRDTGPGIPEKELARVFDPFYTTKETGTGLGLSISYGIVSKHGGEIEIKSVAEGKETGTTVTVRLPKLLRPAGEKKV